jgi:prepilin-type N-terminal cleavage/methylation domain-containing protein
VRPGFSLLELLVALTLGGLVLSAATATLLSQTRLARVTAAQAQRNEVLRVAAQVLSTETRWLNAARDVRAWSSDSLSLRAFRASGTVCHVQQDGSALASLVTLRAPDADKDSLLILRDSSIELAAQLLSAAPATAPCGTARTFSLRTSEQLHSGDVVLLFESGNYYLADRALRYRLGGEGRQPLTEEAFVAARTHFLPGLGGGAAELRMAGAPPSEESMQLRLSFLGDRPR